MAGRPHRRGVAVIWLGAIEAGAGRGQGQALAADADGNHNCRDQAAESPRRDWSQAD
ncbi:MAG: hypothetical protein WCQ77_03770 [Planctomycetota bacterium]